MTTSLEKALLLTLVDKTEARQTKTNFALLERFRNAGWIKMSSRNMMWRLSDGALLDIEKRLHLLWPLFKEDKALLLTLGLDPYRSRNIEALPGLRE